MSAYSNDRIQKINKIKEIYNIKGSSDTMEREGFVIVSEQQIIKLMIDNEQQCCENWGYFLSEDDLDTFIGADIINVYITDMCLNTKLLPKTKDEDDGEYLSTMFINIETDRGLLQFTAYNLQNGYYGHDAFVFSNPIDYRKNL